MNNLQFLYLTNDDFQRFITNHLVVFEHWYTDDLAGASIEDDIEAHNWLMANRYSSGSDYNDEILPEPCLRLDFGGDEFKSVELGNGTGFVRVDSAYSIIEQLTKELATARNDRETLQLYTSKVRDLLVKAYAKAMHFYEIAPTDRIIMGELEELMELHNDMQELGIEV